MRVCYACELPGGNFPCPPAPTPPRKRVDNYSCLGQQIAFCSCGFKAYCSAIYFHSFSVPLTIRWNPTNKAGWGRERIKRKVSNDNLRWFVFDARGLTKHSGCRRKYELKSGSSSRPHTNRKFCSFLLPLAYFIIHLISSMQLESQQIVRIQYLCNYLELCCSIRWPLAMCGYWWWLVRIEMCH